MPRPLNSTDNFETIKNWLDGTLTDTNSFTPNRDAWLYLANIFL